MHSIPLRNGDTFIRVPRCGTIPKAFDGHPQFLLARPGLVKSKSANGRHPIFGVVVKAAKLRDFTSGLWRCDQKQKSRTCQCEVARLGALCASRVGWSLARPRKAAKSSMALAALNASKTVGNSAECDAVKALTMDCTLQVCGTV